MLTHFEFGSYYNNEHMMDYPAFENMLLIHQNTLKHIDIGYLSPGGNLRLFNATRFSKLEFLKLSRWQMSRPVQFSVEDSNVLGPSLKTFAWDFSIYDQHSESWTDFGAPEAAWLRELGEIAISRKAALEKIVIQYTPECYHNPTEEEGYPWDRMDKVRDETLKPNGLSLEYNEPSVSKDKWLHCIRTGGLESETHDATVLDTAREEDKSAGDKEEVGEGLESDSQGGYHGEDIRGYLTPRSSTA